MRRLFQHAGPAPLVPMLVALAAAVLLGPASLAAPPWKKTQPGPAPAGPPPQAPEAAAPNVVSVDLSRINGPSEFRDTVTPDQRIHVHIDFGRVFEAQGNFEAALLEYQQALEACERRGFGRGRSADEALAHRRIGNALDRLGRFAQAEVHYRKAVRLSPKDPKVWNDAGYSYYLQGRWADAERTFKTAARLAPDDARIQTNLGLVLAASGRTAEALPLLSKYSGDAIGHANLGYLLAATGQVELARQQYLQALALRPNLEVARRALARLERASGGEEVAQAPPPPVRPGAVAAPTAAARPDATVVKTATGARIPPPRRFDATAPAAPRR